jgi:two-component system response regulator YesN
MTIIEYVKNFRFAKALEMLKDTSVSISQIAAEVGYDDPCYFTRQFRQMLKMSPSEYRRIGIKEF